MPSHPGPDAGPLSASAVVRELAIAYHAVHSFDADHLRQYGLTPSQANVIYALGSGSVLSCRELAEAALISRGSLSGVLERLETRGLVTRRPSREDRRKMMVRLTPRGADVFLRLATDRIAPLAARLDRLDERQRGTIIAALQDLHQVFR